MKISWKISAASFVLSALFSCSDYEGPIYETEADGVILQGTVTDQEGRPLEKIRITVENEDRSVREAYYTSSEGSFRCNFPVRRTEEQILLDITIDDIDGEENGGLFESKTDVITIFKDEHHKGPVMIDLPTYRLTPATASENIPQS